MGGMTSMSIYWFIVVGCDALGTVPVSLCLQFSSEYSLSIPIYAEYLFRIMSAFMLIYWGIYFAHIPLPSVLIFFFFFWFFDFYCSVMQIQSATIRITTLTAGRAFAMNIEIKRLRRRIAETITGIVQSNSPNYLHTFAGQRIGPNSLVRGMIW